MTCAVCGARPPANLHVRFSLVPSTVIRARSTRCRPRGSRSVPYRGQVSGRGPDLLAFGGGQRPGTGGGEPVVLLTQPLALSQRGLQVLLQLPGNQAVLRLDQLVLAPDPLCLIAGAFRALPPHP